MTVLCPRQRRAFGSEQEALWESLSAVGSLHAHLCPICEHWHAGPFYRGCASGKVPHADQQEAQRAADRLNANPDGWGKSYPYECSTCGQWHCGRPHKGKTLQ